MAAQEPSGAGHDGQEAANVPAAETPAGGTRNADATTVPPLTPSQPRPKRDLFGLEGHDLLPDLTTDERDGGWGDGRGFGGDSSDAGDLRRFLDEKPPHHL